MSPAVLEPPPKPSVRPKSAPPAERPSTAEVLAGDAARWPRVCKDDYHRMIERGLFDFGRYELLDGFLVRMPAHDPEHAEAVRLIVDRFYELFRKDYEVRCQLPMSMPADWEPEPDVLLSTGKAAGSRHPTPADIVLAVEVGRTSGRTDRHIKLPQYAKCGIPEVWLVDVHGGAVHVFREPDGDAYRSQQTFTGDEPFGLAAKPGPTLTAAEILTPQP